MSELAQAIEEMRNMRESYDQLAGAAEAYNEGKPALAEAITAKGVEAAATDSLATMAEKVMTISQDTYEIDGGEMYAKQLFGSLETPNYWNLYDILAQLLSDGRLVNYGGILLAEYYKGYDSLALSGAGSGGAYVVSDKDENGQFKMYTADTTHTWATEFDGKGNRWVAYCFAGEYHDFQITDTNTSPRSIFIGRKVGTIKALVNGRISQVVVPDGNKLKGFNTQTYTQNFGKNAIFRNIQSHNTGNLVYNQDNIETLYVELDSFSGGVIFSHTNSSAASPSIFIFKCASCTDGQLIAYASQVGLSLTTLIIDASGAVNITKGLNNVRLSNLKDIFVVNAKNLTLNYDTYSADYTIIGFVLHIQYAEDSEKTNAVSITNKLSGNGWSKFTDIDIQQGWCMQLNVSLAKSLTEANMYAHILQRLKQDEPDCGDGVTITLGATNLAKLTSEESVALLDSLTNVYGYTFA